MGSSMFLGGTIKAAPIENGCCIRVEGRGTMKHSRAAHDIAHRTLGQSPQSLVVFDLTSCSYLDSTFIGCLLTLYREYGRLQTPRFHIASPAEHRAELLGVTKLDNVLPSVDAPPATTGQWVEVDVATSNPRELAEHVMDCHRRLSEIDCPMAGAFAKIADQMQRELGTGV
jgi:anti-anti-sigma regulatory factor